MTEQSINDAIWSGNYWGPNGAIARAQREYEAPGINFAYESSEELVEKEMVYMNALYSAFGRVYPSARKGNPLALWRVAYAVFHLHPFLAAYADYAETKSQGTLSADRMEMLGAMLVKYASVPFFGGHTFRDAAVTYAVAAQRLTQHDPTSHTAALAALTLARADIAVEGTQGRSREHLRYAERQSVNVTDANQRARILRSLAELWKELGETDRARTLIRHAQEVPGIGDDVREKIQEVKKTI